MKVCDAFNLLIISNLRPSKRNKCTDLPTNDAIDQIRKYMPFMLAKTDLKGETVGKHFGKLYGKMRCINNDGPLFPDWLCVDNEEDKYGRELCLTWGRRRCITNV